MTTTRGPYVFTINWEPGTPLMCSAQIPIGASAAHVRILSVRALTLVGETYQVVVIYDAPDLAAPMAPRQLVGVQQGGAIAGPAAEGARCLGGFVHPRDGSGWLLYEVTSETSILKA